MSENPDIQTNTSQASINKDSISANPASASSGKPKDSFVKLAMRNMVKKGSTSLFHFFLTVVGVFGTLIGLAVIFH